MGVRRVPGPLLVAVAMLLLCGGQALAQAPGSEVFAPAPSAVEEAERAREARERFAAGLADYDAGRFREAIAEFEAATRLVPSADLWFNIARAHERLGEHTRAAESYRRYLRDRVDAPDAEVVEAKIAALEAAAEAERQAALSPSAGTLVVRSDREGAEVRVDGELAATTPVAAPLAVMPERHRLEVSEEGTIPFRAEVQVEPGMTTVAHSTLVAETEYRTVGRRRLATWVLAGLAVGSLAASVGLGIHAKQLNDADDRAGAREWARYSDYATAGVITFGLGATIAFFLEGRATRTERLEGSVAARP